MIPPFDIPITEVAASVSALLAPYLPYLIKIGEKAAGKSIEEVGKKVGEDAWAKIKTLWAKLQPKIAQSDEEMKKVSELAARVESADESEKPKQAEKVANMLEFEIERALKSDAGLAQSVAELIKKAQDDYNEGAVFNIHSQIAEKIFNVGHVDSITVN
jgi:hypothetical protein